MKIFNIYSTGEVKIEDPGVKRYLNLDEKLVLKSVGRAREKFAKAKVNIMERLANLLGVPGHRGKKHKIITAHSTGKYSKNMKIVLDCFEIIQKKTEKNPIQVLVKAIENSAPRDEVTVIEYGGARYPQAVDVSPLRRLNISLRNIVHGAYDKSFNKKTKIPEALAQEIMLAAEGKMESFAMGKKNESEKQADSAR
jgi:small subunit ribosomal protein S7